MFDVAVKGKSDSRVCPENDSKAWFIAYIYILTNAWKGVFVSIPCLLVTLTISVQTVIRYKKARCQTLNCTRLQLSRIPKKKTKKTHSEKSITTKALPLNCLLSDNNEESDFEDKEKPLSLHCCTNHYQPNPSDKAHHVGKITSR